MLYYIVLGWFYILGIPKRLRFDLLQQKNYLMVYHILHGFFTQPEPVYRGD